MKKDSPKLGYKVDNRKFKRHLKANLLEMLEAEPVAQTNWFSLILPKLSVVAALLVVVMLGNQVFPAAPDAYAFIREAQEKYEQNIGDASVLKTVTQYADKNKTYLLHVWEDLKNDSVKIKVEDEKTKQALGEILIKDKKLYSEKQLKETIKKGIKKEQNSGPLADILTKKLTVEKLFFEDALAQKDLKYEGEVEKDNKKVIKLSHSNADIYFDAETFNPIEFIEDDKDSKDDEEDFYPNEFKFLEQSYKDEWEEDFFEPEEEWEEVKFDFEDHFYPDDHIDDIIPYELEVYKDYAGKDFVEELEEELDKLDNIEDIEDIEDLEELLNSLEKLDKEITQEIYKNKHEQQDDFEDFDEMKKEITGFLHYLGKNKDIDVGQYLDMVNKASTLEELESLEYKVPQEIKDLYEEVAIESDKLPMHGEDNKNFQHYQENKFDFDQSKSEIKDFLDYAKSKEGIDTAEALKLLENAKTQDELDALEHKMSEEIMNAYENSPFYEEEKSSKHHEPDFDYDPKNDEWSHYEQGSYDPYKQNYQNQDEDQDHDYEYDHEYNLDEYESAQYDEYKEDSDFTTNEINDF